jgi:hypothetical protein
MSNDTLNARSTTAAELDTLRRIRELDLRLDRRANELDLQSHQRTHELHMRLSERIHELEMRMLRPPPPEKWYSSLSAACLAYWLLYGAIWVGLLTAAAHSGR